MSCLNVFAVHVSHLPHFHVQHVCRSYAWYWRAWSRELLLLYSRCKWELISNILDASILLWSTESDVVYHQVISSIDTKLQQLVKIFTEVTHISFIVWCQWTSIIRCSQACIFHFCALLVKNIVMVYHLLFQLQTHPLLVLWLQIVDCSHPEVHQWYTVFCCM